MSTDVQIPAEEARRRVEDEEAVLVCAYDDPTQCEALALEESISWRDFLACRSEISVERPVILYGNEDDDLAELRATALRDEGRERAFAMAGGFEAARDVGLVPEA